jgi:outer membrane protein
MESDPARTAPPHRRLARLGATALAACLCGVPAFGGDEAPPSAFKPWSPPELGAYEKELAQSDTGPATEAEGIAIDPGKVYDLQELIDIAERTNPRTRSAWERACQAAAAVGLSRSAYYPTLAASAGAAYERAFTPFPSLTQGPGPADVSIAGGGTLVAEAALERAAVAFRWLLLDFGERKAATTSAREWLMAANVSFNAVHQQIVFAVTRRFYELNVARQRVTVAQTAVDAAAVVAQSARARLEHGLAIKPESLQAEQQSAQAAFDLEAARGALSEAETALVESLGVRPTAPVRVAEVPEDAFPGASATSANELIDRALSQRPDLVARFAEVRARQAEVDRARAAFYPKIVLDANAGYTKLDVSIEDSKYFGGTEPVYGAGVFLHWSIFDGFARRRRLDTAESELRAAQAALADSRNSVIREVAKARTDFETALRKRESAAKLVAASDSAFNAFLEAYRRGVGTYVEVGTAQRDLAAARSLEIDTRSAIYTSAAALAVAVGDLARAGATPPPYVKP